MSKRYFYLQGKGSISTLGKVLRRGDEIDEATFKELSPRYQSYFAPVAPSQSDAPDGDGQSDAPDGDGQPDAPDGDDQPDAPDGDDQPDAPDGDDQPETAKPKKKGKK